MNELTLHSPVDHQALQFPVVDKSQHMLRLLDTHYENYMRYIFLLLPLTISLFALVSLTGLFAISKTIQVCSN